MVVKKRVVKKKVSKRKVSYATKRKKATSKARVVKRKVSYATKRKRATSKARVVGLKAVVKRTKKPVVVRALKKTHKVRGIRYDLSVDKRRMALKPGKRISKNGKVYYESRQNRSDVSKRRRL